MKPVHLVAALAISTLAAIPLGTVASQPLNIAASFSPNPPKQGTETITVQISDGSHKPVNGASVSISTAMPSMSMSGPSAQATSKGNGRYVASVNLAFAARWTFKITAKVDGKVLTRTIAQDVK